MRAILVPVEAHSCLRSVLETALLLGQSLSSYIEGFALGPAIPNVYAVDVAVISLPILDERERAEMAADARQRFESFMQAHHVTERFGEPNGLSFGWHGDALQGDPYVGDYGRAFDAVVVGRPSSGDAGPRRATLEEALFNSGRAVLVAPPLPTSSMRRSVVIAWNGSTETARAISFAMPLLLGAEKVTILTVQSATVPGPTGEQIARTLRINGVPAQALDVDDEGRSPGEAIRINAEDLGADLLVKGAYTQSRLRQMIFGGPTRYLLEHATVPMLMAH
jgi:nucleotide-binding universal stress UspA family protein